MLVFGIPWSPLYILELVIVHVKDFRAERYQTIARFAILSLGTYSFVGFPFPDMVKLPYELGEVYVNIQQMFHDTVTLSNKFE